MKTTSMEATVHYDDKVRRILLRKGLNTYELDNKFNLRKITEL